VTVPYRGRSHRRLKRLPAAILTLLTAALLALAACTAQGSPGQGAVVSPSAVPPIDLAAPQQTKTATFALG
jgi:hypothetical protein